MSAHQDSNLFARIMVAVVVILSSMGFYSIAWDIWKGQTVSTFEKLVATLLIIFIVAAIGYVIIQRIQMRKTETFRREKW